MIAKHIGQTINCSLQTWMVGMFYLLLYLLEKKESNVDYSETTFNALGFTRNLSFNKTFSFLTLKGEKRVHARRRIRFGY